jgi:hypothetical protein
MLSRDVYAYAAQGALVQAGFDPYRVPVRALGRSAEVLTVDPMWRGTGTPYGPFALRVEQLCSALAGGNLIVNIVLLRALAVLCVGGIVLLAWRCASPAKRSGAVWLACSPLVLLQLIAACHLEALLTVLLLTAGVLATRHRYGTAAAVVVAAAEVKGSVAVLLVVLVVYAYRSGGWAGTGRVSCGAVLVGTVGTLSYLPDAFGWVANIKTTTLAWSPFTPASTLFLMVAEALPQLGRPGLQLLLTSCRVATALVAIALIATLYRCRARLGFAPAAALTLVTLLAAAPVIWPWYLAPVCALLLLGGRRCWRLSQALACTASLAALPLQVVMSQRVMLGAELLIAGSALAFVRRAPSPGPRPESIPPPSEAAQHPRARLAG